MPSRYYKILLPVLVFIAAIGAASTAGYQSLHERALHQLPSITASSTPEIVHPVAPAASSSSSTSHAVGETAKVSATPPVSSATFIIGDSHYLVAITAGQTIEAAMRSLAAQKIGFTFTEKSYPGLGEFIDSIDGKPNGSGNYWFLYVNGKSSDTGASSTHLAPGDTVEWRYDHNY